MSESAIDVRAYTINELIKNILHLPEEEQRETLFNLIDERGQYRAIGTLEEFAASLKLIEELSFKLGRYEGMATPEQVAAWSKANAEERLVIRPKCNDCVNWGIIELCQSCLGKFNNNHFKAAEAAKEDNNND